jgi:hypothetical protein
LAWSLVLAESVNGSLYIIARMIFRKSHSYSYHIANIMIIPLHCRLTPPSHNLLRLMKPCIMPSPFIPCCTTTRGVSASCSRSYLIGLTSGDFIFLSLSTSLLLYLTANKLLISPSSSYASTSDTRVEFTYAFDVAVNSFFPAFLICHVILLGLSKVVVRDNWICLFFGK